MAVSGLRNMDFAAGKIFAILPKPPAGSGALAGIAVESLVNSIDVIWITLNHSSIL